MVNIWACRLICIMHAYASKVPYVQIVKHDVCISYEMNLQHWTGSPQRTVFL